MTFSIILSLFPSHPTREGERDTTAFGLYFGGIVKVEKWEIFPIPIYLILLQKKSPQAEKRSRHYSIVRVMPNLLKLSLKGI